MSLMSSRLFVLHAQPFLRNSGPLLFNFIGVERVEPHAGWSPDEQEELTQQKVMTLTQREV